MSAITTGVGTILNARKVVLVASGKTKPTVIAEAVEELASSMVTAGALQSHRATVVVDEDAAAGLTQREYYEFLYAAKPAVLRA